MNRRNLRIVLIVESIEPLSPTHSLVLALESIGCVVSVFTEARHPQLVSPVRSEKSHGVSAQLGGTKCASELVEYFVRRAGADILLAVDGNYSVSRRLDAALDNLEVKTLSINFKPVRNHETLIKRSRGFKLMTVLPEDHEEIGVRGSAAPQHIFSLAPVPCRSLIDELGTGVRCGPANSVLVSRDGLSDADCHRLAAIFDTYNQCIDGAPTQLEWAPENYEALVSKARNHQYFWRADCPRRVSSLGDYRTALAFASGAKLVAAGPRERWGILGLRNHVDPTSRFDGLAAIWSDLNLATGSEMDSSALDFRLGDTFVNSLVDILSKVESPAVVEEGSSTSTVLVSGWFGSGNTGDEMILETIVRYFDSYAKNTRIIAVSPMPGHTEKLHGIPCIDRNDFAAVEGAVRRSDAAILGGGGLMQDYAFESVGGVAGMLCGPSQSIGAYGALSFFADVWQKPWFVYGQGIGPLRSQASRQSVRHLYTRAVSVNVRDTQSMAELQSIDGWNRRVCWAPDPVFAIPRAASNPTPRVAGNRRYLFINLRPWAFSRRFSPTRIIEACAEFARTNDCVLVGFPLSAEDEMLLIDCFADTFSASEKGDHESLILPHTLDSGQLTSDLQLAHLVVGMRYHSSVLSMVAGTPVVGLGYDPKVKSLFHDVGQSDYLLDLNAEPKELQSALGQAWAHNGRLPVEWAERVNEFQSTADQGLRGLVADLERAISTS